MNNKHEFFIAGKTRNKDYILTICDLFDKYNISYYCFLKNDETINSYASDSQSGEDKMAIFENLDLITLFVYNITNDDLRGFEYEIRLF